MKPYVISKGSGFCIPTRADAIPARSAFRNRDSTKIAIGQSKCAAEVDLGILQRCEDEDGWLAPIILADKGKG
ncbi:hypothetical protein SARC_07132 [Sphaeroforma arctica JP610]|uniref:Uncharacterized protein n=1 Tax=Sphaeroforma arctica JP610 TaxID=667725 RepID=A0A0L0FUH9_9EUKA|nr:hypothetical protein SARC_07132 [Sphaeroforma arctica JP610]KNC80510.1 hypothetical protein SARC_07132 [Sphaeroforma arctica JP610]|eukprot:XP_014154412.1 hypothetical protein SARC_07132 [Sphaeroforma arctica JP610]